ncbi:MAG TPA: glycosyltransferase family 39 protein [Kofleriaceae bacterium]|jgi:hypothetical protein|nr:glycosyltransferase family 39 protein [Kofleriaceae bacterium]
MPRVLRIHLLGCLAFAAAYLVLHVGESLRLDLGDAWSDAQIALGHTPAEPDPVRDALAGYLYRAIDRLGVHDVAAHRGVALALSVLGAWWLFQYARRMWDATTALLATALYTTSLVWLQTADSLERPPLVLSGCFLALWGTARTIETGQRRHAAASVCGAFVCMLAGSDLWLFLPAGLLFTIHKRRGDPFAWRNLRFVAMGALGCIAGAVASALVAGGTVDAKLAAAAPGMVRRSIAAFTPMVWVTVGLACWRALRAATLGRALEDAATWMLAAAAVGLAVTGTSGRMVDALPALPFYAIGSALVIARLLTAGGLRRTLGLTWAVVAPVWALVIVLASPRTVLDRDDVAQARAYFAGADRNDFVITNLIANSVIEVAFDRHSLPIVARGEDAHDARLARRWMLGLFESTGTDYLHAVIVRTPAIRFQDAQGRLTAVGAQPVLHLRNFDVYRVDRAAVLAVASRSLQVVRQLDFASVASDPHKLLGWSGPDLDDDGLGTSRVVGYGACANPLAARPRADAPAGNACETVRTPAGVGVIDERHVDRAQLMIRVDRPCDLRLLLTLASTSRLWRLPRWLASTPRLGLAINGFTASQCAADPRDPRAEFLVPVRFVHAGINILTIAKRAAGPLEPRGELRALTIDPVCTPEP